MTRHAHTISPSRLEEIPVTEQAPAGLEYKTLALAEVPLRLQVKSVALSEPAGPGTNGAVNAPYEYVDEDGNHIGVAESFVAVTGVRDKVGDVIPAGAFERTLAELEPKACLGHDWNRPIGYPESIEEWLPGDRRLPEKKVDGSPWPEHAGVLRAITRYNLGTDDGRRAYADAKFFGPQRTAWSIGYVPSQTKTRRMLDPHTGLPSRFLHDLDLFEYSQVLHGAHPMALSQSIKSGGSGTIETKARFVQDQSYWGYPKGTPIRPGMRPRGTTARRIREQGKTPSPNEGVTTEAPKPDGPAPKGTRGGVDRRMAGGDAEGLFPEPQSDNRVRAEGAKGKDEQHVADLAMNEAGDLEGEPDDNRDKAFRGLLKEGITPNELRSDLENVADNEHNTSSAALEPDDIDGLVEEYTARYDALAKRQGRQRRGQPEEGSAQDGAGQPPPQQEPDGGAPGEAADGGPEGQQPPGGAGDDQAHTPEGDTGAAGEAPAAPKTSTDKLATMNKRQAAQAAAGMEDDELASHDDELTRRAAALGKAGKRSDAHQAVVAEREKRAAAGPTQGEPGEPGGETDAGATTPDGRPLSQLDKMEFETELTESRQAMLDLRRQRDKAQRSGGRPPRGPGVDLIEKRSENAEAENARRHDEDARKLAENEAAGLGDEGQGAVGGTSEGTDQGVENADDQEGAGQAPPPEGDIAPDAGPVPPGPDQVPPRTPLNERGDSYDAQGNLIEGGGRFGDAENAALDALADGDEVALGEALDSLREQNFVELTLADGTRLRRGESTGQLAAELVNSDPAASRRRILEWAATGNARHQADTQNQHGAQVAAFDELSDDDLDAEEARLLQQRADFAADDASPYDTVLWENGIMLRALAESRAKRGAEDLPGADAIEPDEDDGAVITTDEIADAEELADASHGVTEADDGVIEVDPDVAERQERVAGLLTQASTGGGLDLSNRDDTQLRADRSDVVAELRLQNHLENRRRKQNGDQGGDDPATADDTGRTTGRRASGEITDDQDEGKPEQPPGPPTRPGVAGAAEDFADALESGDPDAIDRTRARLASSLRRSRTDTDAVKSLRALMDGPADPNPADLRDAAEAVRADARARRNESARNRRTARRFERERLRSLLGQIESEMSNRGLSYDTAPEDFAAPDNDGALPGGAVNPTAGTWVQRTESTEWSGQQEQVAEVSGSHYTASVYTPQGRRSTYEWVVTDDQGNTIASGSGETPDQPSAQGAIEIALDTQAKLGNLPADATLPTGNLPTDSSRRPAEEVQAALDAVRERLTRPERPVNPITGMTDPLTGPGVATRPPTSRAFDDVSAVRAYLDGRAARGVTVPVLDKIRWDDITLSPGGQFMVTTLTGESRPVLLSTTHGLIVRTAAGGIAPDRLAKADLLRIGGLMESMRDNNGRSVDWTVEAQSGALKAQMDLMDFGAVGTGQDAIMGTALRTLALEKIRAGKWQDKLVRQVGRDAGSTAGVTNWTRREYTRGTHRVLGLQLASGFGRKQSPEDRKTLAIADGAELLANMGAPDAAAVLLRRRAAELGSSDNATPLLENMAIGYLGAYSPVRSMGDRAVNLRMGERLSFADPDTGGVRTFRALSPMRQEGGAYGGSTALVVDEGTGKMFDAKIGNAVGGGQRISLYNRDIHEGRGYADHTSDLGSSGFAVTGPGEPVPVDRDELRLAATADASAFGEDILDAAADTLPESAAERDRRRGSAPDGERPPRRTSPRAPRRKAPKPDEVKPVPGEAHLADVQGKQRDRYMGGDFVLADEAGSGGFESLDDARELAAAWVAAADPADYAGPHGGTGMPGSVARGVTPGYMIWRVANSDTFTEAGGAKLSPGGHFIITKDNLVIHARTGGAVWGMGETMEATTYPTRDSAMAVADYLERARFDGQGIDWAAPRASLVAQTRKALGSRAREKLQPGALVARAAIIDLLANTKTPPKGDDLDSARNVLDALDRQGMGITSAPNPDVFTVYENRLKTNRYAALGGQRVQGADMLPADSKAGERVAKKVRDELRIAETLGQVAPLDAVRRLNTVADSVDGQQITDSDGKTFNPAADLRDMAKQITDAWDGDKPSPLGRLLRNDSRGTIRPTRPIEIESNAVGTEATLVAGEKEAERLSRVLARYPLRLDRDDNGDLRARFGLNEIISDGFSEKIAIKLDGSIEITWPHNKIGRMRLYLPPGSWDFDPNMDTDLPDATGVGTGGGTGTGELGDTAKDALERLATFREQATKQVVDALGAKMKVGGSTDINDANYDPGYMITQNVIKYMQIGDFDNAKQGLRTINRFYRGSVRPDFDAEELTNQIDSLSITDEVLADAAPFAPAVGGTPEKRAVVNDLMFGITGDGHPDAVKGLKRITLYDGGIEGASPDTLADYNLQSQVMRVAGTALDNPDDTGDEDKGWFSDTGYGLLERTLTHEYGHHLHNMLIQDDPAANHMMMEEIAEALGVSLLPSERGYGSRDWVERNQSTIVAKIGTYAATNHYELVTELFTQWRGRREGGHQAAQVVGRYLGNPSFEGGGESELGAEAPPVPATGDQQRANLASRAQDYFGGGETDTGDTAEQGAAAPEETGGEVMEDDNATANA